MSSSVSNTTFASTTTHDGSAPQQQLPPHLQQQQQFQQQQLQQQQLQQHRRLTKNPPPTSYNPHAVERALSRTAPTIRAQRHYSADADPSYQRLSGQQNSLYGQPNNFTSNPHNRPPHLRASLDEHVIGHPLEPQRGHSAGASPIINPSRPAHLVHSHTFDSSAAPRLRQSQSFASIGRKMERVSPPRSDASSGTKSPRQRYSDDASGTSGEKKKKNVFSTLINGMGIGGTRRPTISTPTNPMHVTHVGIDNETGEYTVRCHLTPHLTRAHPAALHVGVRSIFSLSKPLPHP